MTTGVVTTSFPRYPGDFAGCFVEDDVRERVRHGELVEVVAAGDRHGDGCRGDRADLEPAVRVVRIPMPSTGKTPPLFFGAGAPEALEQGGAAAWTQAMCFWVGLCQSIHARAPAWNRIVAHWLIPCGLAARAVAPQLPLTVYAHSGDVALLERLPGGASLARHIARQADDLIFVSTDLLRRFARLSGVHEGRVARLPSSSKAGAGFESAAKFSRNTARGTLGVDRPIVLAVGRLVAIKGFDVLLRAFARAFPCAGAPSVPYPKRLVILGEGPERPRLEAIARRLNVDLLLPGVVPRDDVRRWMGAADVYVQPSRPLANGRTEGLPVAMLEALDAGLPVIASRTGGMADLTGSPHLRLIRPDDPAAIARCLVELL